MDANERDAAAHWDRLRLENPERYAAAQTKHALRQLYTLYVLHMHGAGTCDCDTHVPVCAPCLARDALGISLADERAAARADERALASARAADAVTQKEMDRLLRRVFPAPGATLAAAHSIALTDAQVLSLVEFVEDVQNAADNGEPYDVSELLSDTFEDASAAVAAYREHDERAAWRDADERAAADPDADIPQ
jgi:hypothetical protein